MNSARWLPFNIHFSVGDRMEIKEIQKNQASKGKKEYQRLLIFSFAGNPSK
jgi:hypothetical protein